MSQKIAIQLARYSQPSYVRKNEDSLKRSFKVLGRAGRQRVRHGGDSATGEVHALGQAEVGREIESPAQKQRGQQSPSRSRGGR